MGLSVAHLINRRAWNGGKPWKRTTWAQLRAKERATCRKEAAQYLRPIHRGGIGDGQLPHQTEIITTTGGRHG